MLSDELTLTSLGQTVWMRQLKRLPTSLMISFGLQVGLDAVAALPSVRTATGETAAQLYLFEQVTRLDCLVMDSATAPKRNRTRHQHFWRNRYLS